MDDFFNYDVAEWIYDRVSKMDDAEAEMFTRFFTYEVHKQDLDNNRRLINRHVEEVSKSLLDAYEKISKADDGTPYFDLHGVEQPRGDDGRWIDINAGFKITRRKPPKYGHELKGKTLRQKLKSADEIDVTSALNRTGRATSAFAENWTASGKRDPYTNERTYRRVAAGAQLLGAVPDKRFKAAAAAGQFAGQFGPEAEKVIGPAARRTAYRYRGTERNPDENLIEYEDMALQAELNRSGKSTKDMTPEIRMATSEAAAVAYLAQRLPKKSLAELHRQSGKLPPSEGVIISADGNIVTQAVGYNEDHYLPFNLKNLKGLQGGAYVRTRSSGGLTSEDIYTGLIAGARSITVVSRSGIFTLDFEDDLRGGRRYSDKARQMVGRYAQTLDAVQSEQVARRRLTPDERAEIREEVEEETKGMGYKAPQIEQMIKDRENEFTSAPRLTSSELETINRRAQEATDSWRAMRSGSPSADRVREPMEKVPADPKRRFNYYKSELMDAAMEEKAARMYRLDAEGYKAAMDALEEQFPYFVQRTDYKPLDKTRPPNKEKDVGYVRPNYNRPKAVQAGYFDEDINGAGKFSASQLHYQNLRLSPRGSTATAGQQGAEVKKPSERLSDVQLNAQRAKIQAKPEHAAALKAAADPVAGYVGAYANTYKELARYRDTNGDITNWTQAQLAQLEVDLEGFQKTLADAQNGAYKAEADELARRLQIVKNKSAILNESGVVDRKEWNPRVVQDVPHKFADEPQHNFGQKASDYARGMSMAIKRAGLDDEIDENTSDDQLKTLEKKYGDLYASVRDVVNAKEEDRPALQVAMEDALLQAGRSNEQVRGVSASATPEQLKTLMENFEKKWLGVKEVRSVKHHAKGAVPEAKAEEKQVEAAAPIKGEVIETFKQDPVAALHKAIEVTNDPGLKRAAKNVIDAFAAGTKDDVFKAIDSLPSELRWLQDPLLRKLEEEDDDYR